MWSAPRSSTLRPGLRGRPQGGYLPSGVSAEFVGFGQVLGADGKKFSTREGTAVTLNSLLDAAEEQAAPSSPWRRSSMPTSRPDCRRLRLRVERMVATTGDTGPYLQYAHAG